MTDLFFYGTLRHVPLLETVLGHESAAVLTPAVLPGHAAYWAQGQGFPFIVQEDGADCPGLLAQGLSAQDLARLDFYEGGFGYALREVEVQAGGRVQPARAWFTAPDRFARGPRFDLAEWAARRAMLNTRAAEEVMSFYGQRSAAEVARLYPMIEMRQASRLMGEAEPVPDAPSGLTRDDVELLERSQPYTEYFAVEAQRLRFRQFDGDMGPEVNFAAFKATDAALVLPYDPARDRVMLLEQFRMGPQVRGDRVPWQLEPIAGRVDAGETPEQTAYREALEEAGLHLRDLRPILRGYPSPGCSNEYFHIFLGLADLPDRAAGVGGLAAESENIRSHVMSFDDAMAMFARGQLRVVPLVTALLWLALHRDHLRAGA